MNNKEFIAQLAEKNQYNEKETQKLVHLFSEFLTQELEEGDQLSIQGFGNFEIKKKLERIITLPSSKQKMLIPPKLTISFKASTLLKDKIN